ncbi:MAG: hypothetical protein LH614_18270 [Pyrinomonadaceae bacterium]|nr:hypothetical protein [Pyrinomonadaceae bacterium]
MNELNLTDALEEYALAAPHGFGGQILRQMAEKYPQFAADLQDFAVACAVVKYAPETEISTEDEARYRQIGKENLRAVLSESSASLESLTDAAKAKGLNRSKFANALGLSVSLVQYLEKRRLDFATIPQNVIAKVAEVLETGENLVANYLSQSPVSAANMSFKATTRPEELKPKSFAEAVREDQQLSNEEKRRLLEL